MRTALVAGTAIGGLLLAAGCSSSSPTATPPSSSPSSSATPTPSGSISSAPPSRSATASPTTAPATPVNCPDGSLTAHVGRSTGAAGHIQLVIVLRNVSSTTCRLFGYPGMLLLDGNGKPLPTHVVRGGGVSFPDTPPKGVVLAPRHSASFDAEYSDVPSGSEKCPEASAVEVTPPNDRRPVVVHTKLAPCQNGTIHVSPVVAGSAGLQQ